MNPTQTQLKEMWEWYQARKVQQLSNPIDFASQQFVVIPKGTGTSALTQTYTDSHGDTLTGPKAYLGTTRMMINGVIYEFPYIA